MELETKEKEEERAEKRWLWMRSTSLRKDEGLCKDVSKETEEWQRRCASNSKRNDDEQCKSDN